MLAHKVEELARFLAHLVIHFVCRVNHKVAVAYRVGIAAGEQQLFVKVAQLIYAKALGLPLAQLGAYGHNVFNHLLAVFGDLLCGVVHAAHVHVSKRGERFKAHYFAHAVP